MHSNKPAMADAVRPRRVVGPRALAALAIALGGTLLAEELEPGPLRQTTLRRVDALWRGRRVAHGSAEDVMVRRGLIADRSDRTLLLDVEATGLGAREIVEFPIITEGSGHDYEALFVAFATPGDISAALEFIGVPRGRPVRPEALAFWPKGERVQIAVVGRDGARVPLEELVLDVRNENRPLPRLGFIHAGSIDIERDGETLFAADSEGPGSIASSYNEPTTVLDMPRQAQQGDVYERFVANPDTLFERGALLQLEARPEDRPADAPPRVQERTLRVTLPGGADGLKNAVARLAAPGETPETAVPTGLTGALEALRALRPLHDPYVTLDLDDSLTVLAATELARAVALLDNEDGLRIEPPPPGQLHYRAFLPRDAWRDRSARPTQPCELHFRRAASGALEVTLARIEEIWDEQPDHWRPTLKVHEQPVEAPGDMPARLAATGVRLPVLLVFAPEELRLGELMAYLRPVLDSHPTIHVFLAGAASEGGEQPTGSRNHGPARIRAIGQDGRTRGQGSTARAARS